jgi:hypothetical protein
MAVKELAHDEAVRPRPPAPRPRAPAQSGPSLQASMIERRPGLPPSNGLPSEARAANFVGISATNPDPVTRAKMTLSLQQRIGNSGMAALIVSPPRPALAVKNGAKVAPPPLPAAPAIVPPASAPTAIPAAKTTPAATPPATTPTPAPASAQPAPAAQQAEAQPPPPGPAHHAPAKTGKPIAEAAAAAEPESAEAPVAVAAKSRAPAAAAEPSAGGAAVVKLHMPEPPSAPSKAHQQRIAGIHARAGGKARAQGSLPPAAKQVGDVQKAVTPPDAERLAAARAELIASVNAAPSPEILKLAADIRRAIRDRRPPDEDALVKAEPAKEASEAGNELNASVQGEARKVQDNYGPLNSQPQPAPTQSGAPLPPQPAAPPAPPLNASAAVPDAVPAQNVSLDKDAAATRKQADDAGMNKPAAAEVKSGPIAEAREAQGELDQVAKEDPAQVLAKQKEALAKADADMGALQMQALEALTSARTGAVGKTTAQQHGMVGSEEQMRARAGSEAKAVFDKAQSDVQALLKPLVSTAMDKWDAAKTALTTQFKNDLKIVKDRVDERHSGVGGWFVGVWDVVTGLPGWATEAYDRAENNFAEGVIAKLTEISIEVNSVIKACETIIENARNRIHEIFDALPESLRDWAAQEQTKFDGQLDKLGQEVVAARDGFNKDVSQRAAEAVDEVRAEIAELRKKAGGLVGRIVDAVKRFVDDPVKFIIEGLLEILGISPPAFWAVVAKIKKVVKDIVDDPIGFANNLLRGIGQGFSKFFDNFAEHMIRGFLSWLLGDLKDVQIPKEISVKSIISFFLQLMGITWPNIRRILAKKIGEKNVALIEKVYSLISMLVEQGPQGIYEMIKEKLDPQSIVDQVVQMAVDYMVTAIAKQVAVRVALLFNPAGAILQAIEAIYRVLKWVFENAARIFTLIETIVNGLADIISGNVGGFAKAVERGLEILIAPVLGFIADYFSLGDLPQKVAKQIKSFREWILAKIEAGFDWLIEKGKALLAALGIGRKEKDKKEGGEYDKEVGKSVNFVAGGERHRLWIQTSVGNAVVMMASQPKPVELELEDYRQKAKLLPDGGSTVLELIEQAAGLVQATDANANKLITAMSDPEAKPAQLKSMDDSVEGSEVSLASLIARIREALGIELKDRFPKEFEKMHVLARDYTIGRLDKADKTVKGATDWLTVRAWLLSNGLIYTQPLTRTANYVAQVVQPQAEDAACDAIDILAEKSGFTLEDLTADGKQVKAIGSEAVDKSRSRVNAGESPFATGKIALQEFAFAENIRPYLMLRSAYAESRELAQAAGLGERQEHHLVTNKMVNLLMATQAQIKPQALRNRYIYWSSPGGHIGYETWHRHYDVTMAIFIAKFPPGTMKPEDLILEMHNYYQSDHGFNVTKRIPGVSLI